MVAPPRPSSSASLSAVIGGRVRTASARYRLPRVFLVVAVALAGATVVTRAQGRADDAAAAWGASAPVLVVVEPIAAGAPIPPGAVSLQPVPEGLRPADALDDLPGDARATASLVPGEVLRTGRVDGSAASALAALLPRNHLAFRVAVDGLDASPDDTVRLFDLATGRVVVVAARVLIRDDASITVAVPESDARELIGALGTGGVVAAVAEPTVAGPP